MKHHRHPGHAGRLSLDGLTLVPHADCEHPSAAMTWVPVMSADGRDIEALEGLPSIPTRPGAARIIAVPHVVHELALGDEVAIADWDSMPVARGELASSLHGTIRVAAAPHHSWRWAAGIVDDACREPRACWFDVMSTHAVAASVPRAELTSVFERLRDLEASDELRWSYVTAGRHA